MAENYFTEKVLVLREVKYKDADKILTLYSAERGKFTARAVAALRKASRIASATQQLTYAEMTFYESHGRTGVKEAQILEDFADLKSDFADYALGCYFAECVEQLSEEGLEDADILQLILNALFALSRKLYLPQTVKAAFEMRLMSLQGYRPDLSGCEVCGKEDPEFPNLCVTSGKLICSSCRKASFEIYAPLSGCALQSLRTIVSAGPKAFIPKDLPPEDTDLLSYACETFLLEHAERRFSTLEYWKKVR